jgi:hypothetical protein
MEDAFQLKVKQWVQHDNEIYALNRQVAELRDKREQLNEEIMEYLDKSGNSKLKINLKDGYVATTETTTYTGLSFGFLERVLRNFYKDDAAHVPEIIEHIKKSREATKKKELKRFRK